VAREASRCLHCGACTACDLCWAFCPDAAILHSNYLIDLEHCKGCGICAAECPPAAILLEAVR
jgi:Pyruvate/2-oxoacid:ferredoxin oxidoreductase delta subunit